MDVSFVAKHMYDKNNMIFNLMKNLMELSLIDRLVVHNRVTLKSFEILAKSICNKLHVV